MKWMIGEKYITFFGSLHPQNELHKKAKRVNEAHLQQWKIEIRFSRSFENGSIGRLNESVRQSVFPLCVPR